MLVIIIRIACLVIGIKAGREREREKKVRNLRSLKIPKGPINRSPMLLTSDSS